MAKRQEDSKRHGYTKKCRDCEQTIYLHRGPTGPWRAFEPATEEEIAAGHEWVRHRCTAALQDAEIMHIIAPAGTKPADLVPRLKRLIADFQTLVDQAENANAAA